MMASSNSSLFHSTPLHEKRPEQRLRALKARSTDVHDLAIRQLICLLPSRALLLLFIATTTTPLSSERTSLHSKSSNSDDGSSNGNGKVKARCT